ncbi:MAG: hypothetical protein WEF50_18270 [Myxococcota bacterium]
MRTFAALVVFCLASTGALGATGEPAVRIDLDPPSALGSDASGLVFLSGRALAEAPGAAGLDLVIALDTSDSTDEAAFETAEQQPVDSAPRTLLARFVRWLGFSRSSPTTPTILSEELRAARGILAELDPRTSRVGIVLLAGESRAAIPVPVTALPLTSDFARARALFDWLEAEGSGGQALWSAGVRRSLALLLGVEAGGDPAAADPRRRALLLLTDARLARADSSEPELAAVLDQARRADVRVDALVFGEEASRGAPLLQPLVQSTGGRTLAVIEPADVLEAASAFDHARVARLEVWNDTLAEPARALHRRADGSFGSLVRLAPGENRITVLASDWNGLESRRQIRVDREAVATSDDLAGLAPEALLLRGRLLRTLHQGQIAAASQAPARDLRVVPEAKSPDSAPAAAAPVD